MRITAVSDLHGHLPDIDPCDLLLLAGDLCPVRGGHDTNTQAAWLNGPFRKWLDEVPAETVVGIAGNHDWIFQKAPERVPLGLRWVYLQDSQATIKGLKIHGCPWQPWFHDWAFNARPDQMRYAAGLVPTDTDVLVMHGPPRGYGDRARRYEQMPVHGACGPARFSYENVGCPHLLSRVQLVSRLKLVVFGHIHSGHGRFVIERPDQAHDTVLANVSFVDENYFPSYGVTKFVYNAATGRAEVAE